MTAPKPTTRTDVARTRSTTRRQADRMAGSPASPVPAPPKAPDAKSKPDRRR